MKKKYILKDVKSRRDDCESLCNKLKACKYYYMIGKKRCRLVKACVPVRPTKKDKVPIKDPIVYQKPVPVAPELPTSKYFI